MSLSLADAVRVNGWTWSFQSCALTVDGNSNEGMVAIDWDEKLEVRVIPSNTQDTNPLGMSVGRYIVGKFPVRFLRDSALALKKYLAAKAVTQGLTSYGEANFDMCLQLSGNDSCNYVPTITVFASCRIVGEKTAHEEGVAGLVTEFTVACLVISQDGYTLWNQLPALVGGLPSTDTIGIAGAPAPGKWTLLRGPKVYGWDERKGYGLSGAVLVPTGDELARVRFHVEIWTATDYVAFGLFRSTYLKKALVTVPGGVAALALGIYHPELSALGLTQFVPKEVNPLVNDGFGVWQCEIEFWQYRPPAPALSKPNAAIPGNATPPTPTTAADRALIEAQILKDQAQGLAASDAFVGPLGVSVTATLNGFRVVSVRLTLPYRGVWAADCDLDPDVVALVTSSGPAILVIGSPPGPVASLVGTIDPLAAGSFVATARLRVVGGQGGWSKDVPAQHFHSPAGVLSTAVYSATGAAVLETVADLVPSVLGPDYARASGRASQVLDGVDWWVEPSTGITNVGPRPPAVPDPSLSILSWDPLRKSAEVACDGLVLPGTPLLDTRIGESPVTVRDVEMLFDTNGSRATCWCSTATVSRLQAALQTMVREFSGVRFLAIRTYRVVSPGPDPNTWVLQAIDRDSLTGAASPLPDLIPCPVWTGLAGGTAKLPPSLEVLVGFVDGSPTQPVILAASTLILPLKTALDATVEVDIGPTAPVVAIAGGGAPVGRVGDAVSVTLTSLQIATIAAPGGSGGPCSGGPITITGTITAGSPKVQSG